MAKENSVHLLGDIYGILNEEKTRIKLKIKKMGRNDNKFVYPVIELTDETEHLKKDICIGKRLLVHGYVKTYKSMVTYECGHCHSKNTIEIFKTCICAEFGLILSGYGDEYTNSAVLLGRVFREPVFKYIENQPSPLSNTKYQLAVEINKNTAYFPWVTTFGAAACNNIDRLKVSSQVLVNGQIQTRHIQKISYCENCLKENLLANEITEIAGMKTEYLRNCLPSYDISCGNFKEIS